MKFGTDTHTNAQNALLQSAITILATKRNFDLISDKYEVQNLFFSNKLFTRKKKKTKLRGLSPRANYTDRAAAAGRRS